MLGAYKESTPADQSIQEIVDSVKPTIEINAGQSFSQFNAISYKTQVVAGTNYKIKVQVGDTDYVHVTVFKPLPHTGAPLEVTKVEVGKTLEDQI